MSANDAIDSFEMKGLDQLMKALKTKAPQARVGILGASSARSGSGPSNADVGAAHEFGTSKIPQRSFLRVPLTTHLSKEIESSGALDKNVLTNVIRSGTVLPWLTKIAILSQKVVLDAFSSGGFGQWPAWKGNYSSKTGDILVDTQQLRNSITYEVKA